MKKNVSLGKQLQFVNLKMLVLTHPYSYSHIPTAGEGEGVPGPPCFGSKEKLQRGSIFLLAQEKYQAEGSTCLI